VIDGGARRAYELEFRAPWRLDRVVVCTEPDALVVVRRGARHRVLAGDLLEVRRGPRILVLRTTGGDVAIVRGRRLRQPDRCNAAFLSVLFGVPLVDDAEPVPTARLLRSRVDPPHVAGLRLMPGPPA